jgi:RNA polymerase sigma-70 factor (ECF subfamily)
MVAEGEDRLRALWASGDHAQAATRAVNLYGAEVMSFLATSLRDGTELDDAFSRFLLALWEGLPRFRWDCSMRTWCYALARHAVARTVRERGRARATVALSPELEELAARARSATPSYLRTDVRRRVAALRADLDPDDRQLLVLRVNRRLAWEEVARVLLDDEEPTGESIARKAAALRKRYERLKASLRERARR